MRAVFDLDDTICVHRNRDYPNASPITSVIEKMRKMKADGWEIVIYTARGQVSCNKNLAEIEKKNRQTVEEWIKKHSVPCDELIFGKPIGDVYVDDKGMSVTDFLEAPFHYLKGGSGKTVYRIGNMVKKDLGDDVQNYKNWIEDNVSLCNYPQVISYVYGEVTMRYIEGTNLCDDFTANDFYKLIDVIDGFSKRKKDGFDIKEHIDSLYRHKSGGAFDQIIDFSISKIKENEKSLVKNASFCHGDTTLSNVIKAKDGLYFIDPRYRRNASSYLLDYGKMRMSLMNYERRFGISTADNSEYLPIFDSIMKERGIYEEVIAINLMWICRLYNYKENKEAVAEMAEELIRRSYGGL